MDPIKPKVTPHALDLWSANMGELYGSLEGEIIRMIIDRLNGGSDDILMWQAEKMSQLRLFNRDVARQVAKATSVSESQITRMFDDTGISVIDDIDKAVPFNPRPKPTNLDAVMRSYRDQALNDIDNYVNQTLVTTTYGTGTAQRAYQNTVNRTSALFNTGIYSMEQSLERSITELAQGGIKSALTDKRGYQWSLEGYVRSSLKSTLSNTYNELRTSRMAEYGVYTVLVTSLAGARDQCELIQGNVVDLRDPTDIPPDSEYKSIYDPYWGAEYGTPQGTRGINCRHLFLPFVPGVNTNNQPKYDAELNKRVAEARDKQRRIEREIVKHKKSLMVATELGSDRVSYYKMMVGRRQKAMRNHLSENGQYLSRNYKREKTYTPLETLLKDFAYDN